MRAPLSGPAHCSELQQRKPEAGGRGQRKPRARGRSFIPPTSDPAALLQHDPPY